MEVSDVHEEADEKPEPLVSLHPQCENQTVNGC